MSILAVEPLPSRPAGDSGDAEAHGDAAGKGMGAPYDNGPLPALSIMVADYSESVIEVDALQWKLEVYDDLVILALGPSRKGLDVVVLVVPDDVVAGCPKALEGVCVHLGDEPPAQVLAPYVADGAVVALRAPEEEDAAGTTRGLLYDAEEFDKVDILLVVF